MCGDDRHGATAAAHIADVADVSCGCCCSCCCWGTVEVAGTVEAAVVLSFNSSTGFCKALQLIGRDFGNVVFATASDAITAVSAIAGIH